MMIVRGRQCVLLAVACMVLVSSGFAQDRPVFRSDFIVRDASALDALIRLGEVYRRPIGVIVTDKSILAPVTVRAISATIQDVLPALLKQLPKYRSEEVRGVIVVRPISPAAPLRQLLSVRLKEFDAPKANIVQIGRVLWMELRRNVDPVPPSGFFGISHEPIMDQTAIGPFHLAGANVEDVLSEIVRRHGAAAWLVLSPPKQLSGVTSNRLWNLVTYANPP